MKKALLLVTGFAVYGLQAQVGINTTEPQSTLDVNGDVRIQSTTDSEIPANEKCPCFLVVDREGKIKRVSIEEWTDSLPGGGSGSGGSTGGGGTAVIGGVSPADGGVANQSVLTPDHEVEIGWNTYESNFYEIQLSVNLPPNVPYSAYISEPLVLPTIDGEERKVSIMYPKGVTDGNKIITATLLFDGDHTYAPKLIFESSEEKTHKIPLYFNGVKQDADLVLHAGINAVKNMEHGKEFTYPVVKVGDKRLMAMNLGAKYAEEATTNPAVLKTWRAKTDWQKDYKAYGSLFQWGRPADGHELINWTSPTSGTPVYDKGWKTDAQLTTFHNPCPTGWHVPNKEEWKSIDTAIRNKVTGDANAKNRAVWNDATARFAAAGSRNNSDASFSSQSSYGFYWSSELRAGTSSAWYLHFNYSNSYPENNSYRSYGFSVRCLKD